MVIAIVGGGAPKTHGSRDAMEHTAATSPLYRAWLDAGAARSRRRRGRDRRGRPRSALGELAEANALAMHASAIAARPADHLLAAARRSPRSPRCARCARAGRAAWATMDAGPHVKVLTTADDAPTIAMRSATSTA